MSAPEQKPYTCLICDAPIYNTNLGIDACRACTVFYRRHLNNSKGLLCRKGTNDCYEKKTRPLCRKCRFVRFCVVLAQSNDVESPQTLSSTPPDSAGEMMGSAGSSGGSNHSMDIPDEEMDQAFLDHRSFSLFSHVSPHAALFDRMRKAYSLLCVIRHCGEQASSLLREEDEEETVLHGDGMKFYPVSHPTKMVNLRIMYEGSKQMFEACFDDFDSVSEESKEFILNRSAKLIHFLEMLYRCTHHFPDQDLMMPGYTTYFNEITIGKFLQEKLPGVNKDWAIEQMKANFLRNLRQTRANYKRVNPSNEEFLAMLGLSLWSNEVSRVNEEYMELVSHNRSEILAELHKVYMRQGRTDYSSRLGDLFCLLNSIEQNAEQSEEDMQLVKLMVDKASCGIRTIRTGCE